MKNSPSGIHAFHPVPTPAMPMSETGQAPAGIMDVLAIGQEATVFRPLQRALRPTGWRVAHLSSLENAIAYLRSNVAAVAVVEIEPEYGWRSMVSSLRGLANGPQIILVTEGELPLKDALKAGAFDHLQRPLKHSDLLWAVATAWHAWMTCREVRPGGGLCGGA